MKKSYLLIGLVAVALIVALILWKRSGSGEKASDGGPEGSGADGPRGSASGGAGVDDTGDGSRRSLPGQLPSSVPPDPKAFPYPPRSRPLSEDDKIFLTAGRGPESTGNMSNAREPEPGKASLTYRLTLDRSSVFGNESATANLSVFRGAPGARVPLQIESAELRSLPRGGEQGKSVLTLQFNDEGKGSDSTAGDLLWSASIAPGSSRKVDSSTYVVAVRLAVEGDTKEARAILWFARDDDVPARFTGTITERIVEGSLLLHAELDVKREGNYDFQANLFDVGDGPVGRASYRVRLEKGKRLVPLTFFGLMFHEKGRAGPYLLRQLRGTHLDSKLLVPMLTSDYKTKPYRIQDFSSATWSSKQSRAGGSR